MTNLIDAFADGLPSNQVERQTATSGSGRHCHRARLRTRVAYRGLGARAFEGNLVANAVRERNVRGSAWLLESETAEWLKSSLRPVLGWQAIRTTSGCIDWFRTAEWRRNGPSSRCGDRWPACAAGGRRRGERYMGCCGGPTIENLKKRMGLTPGRQHLRRARRMEVRHRWQTRANSLRQGHVLQGWEAEYSCLEQGLRGNSEEGSHRKAGPAEAGPALLEK
jgi:hypothetical protein